jgi:hypothetical protein
MKESITKFDLEAAFKALDEIEAPVAAKGIKANKPALTEIFSKKTKFESLMEEYYDIGNTTELDDAKEAREAEIAKAKLARIEKIVDLEAESPEDLLTSYVGKFIMQCPQCMMLFYKNPEDIEASEEDPDTVNVNEVCQHCGNDAGYTLIGKVGEATEEEVDEYQDVGEVDVDSTTEGEDTEEAIEEESEEASEEDDLDFSADLDTLDINLEDDIEDDEEEKKEESFGAVHGEQVLVEQLNEEADLEVSADEFEKLINSSEFKQPISDSEVRAMMNDEAEAVEESVNVNNEVLKYAVINPDGTFAGIACTSEEEARELAAQKEGRIIVKLEELVQPMQEAVESDLPSELEIDINELKEFEDEQELEEAISDYLSDTFGYCHYGFGIDDIIENEDGEPAKVLVSNIDWDLSEDAEQDKEKTITLAEGVFDKLKNKVANAVDKVADKLNTRFSKADWILENALVDYNNIKVTPEGELVPDENNKRFNTFIVVGFTDKYSNGKTITMAPSFNNKDLVLGKNGMQLKKQYKDADKIAKGWSMVQGNGPAFIYMAKSAEDDNAVFLCEYFKGELANDQLGKYFEIVKKHLKGAKLMAQGGMNQEASEEATEQTESLEAIMNGMEELHEASLEKLISDSLVEAYGNVAGFRLTNCSYLNEQFTVDGTIYFTSGNTRKTTYAFNEGFTNEEGKINLRGLNEKLGLDKQFTITGHTDENKTFITESFKYIKK